MNDDLCPFVVSAESGLPSDSVRAARVQRFVEWKWATDCEFRTQIRRAMEQYDQAWVDRLMYGSFEPGDLS